MRVVASLFLAALPFLTAAAPLEEASSKTTKIALDKRGQFTNEDGIIDLHSINYHLAQSERKIVRGLQNYEANTGFAHPSLFADLDAHAKNEKRWIDLENSEVKKRAQTVGSDPLESYKDQLWHGKISVGTPAKEFDVDFDTGSADIFVPGPNCTDVNCQGHTIFTPNASSTAKPLPGNFTMRYGDGSTVTGHVFTDSVNVAGITTRNQVIGVADTFNAGFNKARFPSDGLFGLGFKNISVFRSTNWTTYVDNLVGQRRLKPQFSFKLNTTGSELTVGGANSRLYQGDFTYVDVTEKAYWQIPVESFAVNGQHALGPVNSIVDTGTTYIVGDTASVAKFYEAIPGSKNATLTAGPGHWTIPCQNLPVISLTFGGRAFNVDPLIFSMGRLNGTEDCVGGISSSDTLKFWVVGDVFLQNVYTTFDIARGRVGFAELAL